MPPPPPHFPSSSAAAFEACGRCIAIAVLLPFLLGTGVPGCKAAPERAVGEVLPHVTVVGVQTVRTAPSSTHLVPLEASRRSEVAPRIGGTIQEILVREEDVVAEGDLLVQIDATEARGGLLAVRGTEERLRARLSDTERELQRARRLFERGMESKRHMEQLETEVAALRAQLREARGSRIQARERSRAASLLAPFHGVVTRVDAEVGEYAAPGQALVTVSVLDPLALEFAITEDEVAHYERGGLSFEVTAGGSRVPARLAWLSSEADPGTTSFPVRLDVPNPGRKLRAGRTAVVQVRASDLPPAPAVPARAIRYRGDRPYLLLLEGYRVRMVPVRVLELRGDMVAIEGPLSAGSEIVLDGPIGLADGDRVVAERRSAGPQQVAKHAVAGSAETTGASTAP